MHNQYPVTNDQSQWLLEKWIVPDKRKQLFVDTAAAAQIAGVSRRTVQDWINSGKLTSLRIGKKYQVLLDSLLKYLGSQDIICGAPQSCRFYNAR